MNNRHKQIDLWKWVVAGAVLAALLLYGLQRTRRPNVLLITIDALRSDHLGCYGYSKPTSPHIDQLAEQGVRFENVTVPRALTWPSLCSIWTGLYPMSHGVRDGMQTLSPDLVTLPRLFREQGYRTGAFVTNYFPEEYDFETFDRFFKQGELQGEWDRKAIERAQQWIEEDTNRPFFCWIHLMGPHTPYDPSPEYAERFTDGKKYPYSGTIDELRNITVSRSQLTPDQLNHLIGRYDAQIAESDALVGQLVTALQKMGRWEKTITVVSADHGEELFDHQHYFAHAGSIYEGSLRVPLVFVYPNNLEVNQTRHELVENLDLFSTLLELTGLSKTKQTRQKLEQNPVQPGGRSLVPLLESPPPSGNQPAPDWQRVTFSELQGDKGTIYAVRDLQWKLVLNRKGAFAIPYKAAPYLPAEQELFNLVQDPREQDNVASENPDQVKRLEEEINQWLKTERAKQGTHLGEDTLNELKSIGYFN